MYYFTRSICCSHFGGTLRGVPSHTDCHLGSLFFSGLPRIRYIVLAVVAEGSLRQLFFKESHCWGLVLHEIHCRTDQLLCCWTCAGELMTLLVELIDCICCWTDELWTLRDAGQAQTARNLVSPTPGSAWRSSNNIIILINRMGHKYNI